MGLPPAPDTVPLGTLAGRAWDAVVVGAGPAGSAAARVLAGGGFRTVLLDRDTLPRAKVCGDALLPDALAALGRLGALGEVRARGFRARTLRVWSPAGIRVDLDVEALLLPRIELDAIVAGSAVGAGALLSRARVVSLDLEPAGVRVRTREGPDLAARVVVVATGARRSLAPRVRGGAPSPSPPDAVAARRYLMCPGGPEVLQVIYHRSVLPGYGWIFPLGGGLYNVGCGAFRSRRLHEPLHRLFRRLLDEFPPARDLVSRGSFVSPLEAAPLRCGPPEGPFCGPGPVVWAGEVAGTTFPFTGEGVGKALATGELAGRAACGHLRSGDGADLHGYTGTVLRDIAPRYRAYRAAERWVARPWVCDLLARRVNRSRRLRRSAAAVLREAASPGEVFSISGVVRSLLG